MSKTRVVVVLWLCTVVTSCFGAVPRVQFRIVGGSDTRIEKHPYQISLRKSGSHTCGGSILNANHVLTAAHCVHYPHSEPADFSVRIGSTYRNEGGKLVAISKINIHPEYDDWSLECDIAVLKLAKSVSFDSTIKPITLPKKDFRIAEGTIASIAGWGGLHFQGPSTSHLQQVSVPIVSNKACSRAYENFGAVYSYHLCAGAAGIDACQGDSGGPLVVKGVLVGIVSWGYGCAFNGYPTVYTRVSEFLDFIKYHM
ncbi:trypsin-1-like [Wyeomyia smithii]|uniref:trypsin-1-like n=1 Tax=Wyeomyia smithii TaxID=174621 RepID=UPI002467C61D|nr:trypsin-1-like [Wyeomyia smithii]